MRKPWLFILLCAIAAQLIGCEYAVDENEYTSKTISYDPSASLFFDGEETGNGSEFESLREKARRVRSSEANETSRYANLLKQAEEDERIAKVKKMEAMENHNKEKEKLKQKDNELKAAEINLAEIEKNLKKSEDAKKTAEDVLAYAKGNLTAKTSAYTLKKTAFTSINTQNTDNKKEREKLNSLLLKHNKDLEEATDAVYDANTEEDDAKSSLDTAEKDLNAHKAGLPEKKRIFQESTKNYNDNQAKIKLYDDYTSTSNKKTKPTAEKTKLEAELGDLTKKRDKSKNDFELLENNLLLKNEEPRPKDDVTVEDALENAKKIVAEKTKELAELKPAATEDEKNKINEEIGSNSFIVDHLTPLIAFKFEKRKVQDLVDKYVELKAEYKGKLGTAQGDVDTKEQAIKDKQKELDAIDQRLTTLANGKTIHQIKKDMENAKKNKKEETLKKIRDDAEKEVNTSEEKIRCLQIVKPEQNCNIDGEEIIGIAELKNLHNNAQQKHNQKKQEKITAEDNVKKTSGLLTAAITADDKYRNEVFIPAEQDLENAQNDMDKWKDAPKTAYNKLINAKKNCKDREEQKETATSTIERLQGEKSALEKANTDASNKEHDALLAFNAAQEKKVEAERNKNDYDSALEQAIKEQQERTAKEKAATTTGIIAGGAVAGVLFLCALGGAMAFLLIRRNKKRKEEEEKAKAKPPQKIKFRDECGLMRVQKPGEKDKLQVDGDDIKIRDRGTTFPTWHNYDHETMNWKHTFDGPEGEGIKSVRKIFYDMNQVEGIPTGPAHDRIEGGDSSTRSSSSRKQKKKGKRVKKTVKDETKDQRKQSSSNPQSSDEKQSGSKSNRANASGSPNPPPSSPSGEEKKKP